MFRIYESLGSIEGASFKSEGETLIGVIYLGIDEGKKPTVILLHGLPGLEKNVDIAYALREMGWNVFIPHYRGCWGSEGKYSFTGIPTDVKNAITFIESKPYVDSDKIFLVGHSMGAWASIVTAAQDKRVKGVVAIAGGASSAEITDFHRNNLDNLIKQRFLKSITLDEAIDDWVKRANEFAAQEWVEKISPRPLLVVGGEQDLTAPPERVRTVFERAKEPKKLVMIEGADHIFTLKGENSLRP
jgi:pimeloyl-ACP methyl ester carboxylesterase